MTITLNGTTGISSPGGDTAVSLTATNLYTTGAVGIGTNNPQANLEASTSSPTYIKATNTNGTAGNAGFIMANTSKTYYTIVDALNNYQIYDGSAGVQRLTIDTSGNVNIKTSNAGITFANSSAIGSSTLNDYETGTWTPTLRGNSTAGSATYSSQLGYYTKVGRVVTASFDIITSSTLSGTSAVQVVLPFTVGGSGIAGGAGVCGYFSAIVGVVGQLVMYLDTNNNIANLVYTAGGSGSGQSYLATTAIQSGTRISGVVQYIATF